MTEPTSERTRETLTGNPWQLSCTNTVGEWIPAGTFRSLGDAAAEIIRREALPVMGIHLEAYAGSDAADGETLSYFEFKGSRALYAIKRSVQ
jgi:hypothetical protein